MRLKTLVFDVDNVLLNFSKAFSIWFNKKNINYPLLSNNPSDYHYGYKKDKIFRKYVKNFINEGISMEPVDKDIPKIMQKLIKNYYIVLLTAYPNMTARKIQLKQNNIPYDELIFSYPNAKHSIIYKKKWNPIIVFEDRPSTIKLLANHNYQVYVPNRWNYINSKDWKDYPNVTLYKNLKDLCLV